MPDLHEIAKLQQQAARYHADLEHWRDVLTSPIWPMLSRDNQVHAGSCLRQAMGMSAYLSKMARTEMGVE